MQSPLNHSIITIIFLDGQQSPLQAATTSSVLLEITLTGKDRDTPTHDNNPERKAASARGDALLEQHNLHRQALQNLGSELPPVQAEGLTTLSRLITNGSPILDIPSTSNLLISLITSPGRANAEDEFTYLNVIRCISQLASRHPHTVAKQLSETYADQNEEITLDQRLRIGEALLNTVQGLNKTLIGESAKFLGEAMLTVAGRRGRRPKTHQAREELRIKEAMKPTNTQDDNLDQEMKLEIDKLKEAQGINDIDAEDPAVTAHSARLLDAWARGAANDEQPEDLRVRASALSILAAAIRCNIAGLGASLVSSAVDMALSILNLETGPESAIVRRASAVLLLDALKAIDDAYESNIDLGFGFSYTSTDYLADDQENLYGHIIIGNIPIILRTLRFVDSREEDIMVRGHVRAAIESYEAWFEKSLLSGIGRGSNEPRFTLGDKLAGLSVDPGADNRKQAEGSTIASGTTFSKPRIEEIE
ncbi:hypothetical protein KEM54_006261 [Ascosphaera aggregata]|nr:hypothetical protein KEM54_006261 [Ascosphaera aggregata]